MPGQGKLTSLLNKTIQRGGTTLDPSLDSFLTALADGSYRVGKGSLTLATIDPVIDTITGDWDTDQGQLTATAWWTGQETADQSLIDQITGLQQTGVFFAFDSDTTTTTIPASYTSSTGAWNQQSGLTTTPWWGNVALATNIAAELQVDKLSFGVSTSNSGSVYTVFWDATAGQVQTVANLNPVISRTWATGYTAASSTTTTTLDALFWDGDSVELQTFAAAEVGTFATSVTDGYRTAVWDTNKKPLLGMNLSWGEDWELAIV